VNVFQEDIATTDVTAELRSLTGQRQFTVAKPPAACTKQRRSVESPLMGIVGRHIFEFQYLSSYIDQSDGGLYSIVESTSHAQGYLDTRENILFVYALREMPAW
jgi:hypothetical protein